MILGDLLEELRENILHDRSDQIAGDVSYLWSDKTLVRYINEAQRRLALKAQILRDATTPQVTQITIRNGVDMYPLHSSVISVLSAKVAGDKADLARTSHASLDTYRTPDSYFFDPSQLSQLSPGRPRAYSTDEYLTADDDGALNTINMRVYPVPDSTAAGLVVNLRVARLPLDTLSTTNLTAQPEVPSTFHIPMLDWAAYLALRMVDVDAGMPQRAEEFRQSFEAHVKEARDEMMRKAFQPLSWSFGQNGFSWEK